jgi:hypothetical protein
MMNTYLVRNYRRGGYCNFLQAFGIREIARFVISAFGGRSA